MSEKGQNEVKESGVYFMNCGFFGAKEREEGDLEGKRGDRRPTFRLPRFRPPCLHRLGSS